MQRPHSSPRLTDTSVDAAEVQLHVLRAMSPNRKVALVEDANRTARRLALAGIAARCPQASAAERVRMLMDIFLGEDLAMRAFGPRGAAPGR